MFGNVPWVMRQIETRTRGRLGVPNYKKETMKKTNISPAEIFIKKLNTSKDFEMLKGYSEETWKLNADPINEGMYRKGRNHYRDREYDSCWYRWADSETKAKAVLEFPENKQLDCRQQWKILWVEPEDRRKGVGRRCVNRVIELATEVDGLCKGERKWKDLHITCNCFCIEIVSNPFWIPEGYWNVDDPTNEVDFSDSEAATKLVEDESKTELSQEKRAVDWKTLDAFYESCGFIAVPELGEVKYYDSEQNRIRSHRRMMNRSFDIGRHIHIAPSGNVEYFNKENE